MGLCRERVIRETVKNRNGIYMNKLLYRTRATIVLAV